ncbi:MAG: RnfH family protein [Pelomonas sp.]|nr:RnfH family protein [Roseateles sp.]
MRVELVWSPAPGDTRQRSLALAAGTSVDAALRGCADFAATYARLAEFKVGVWGRLRGLDQTLRDGDRIEVYRPLQVDPKEARRQRYRARGERIVSRHRPLAGKAGP